MTPSRSIENCFDSACSARISRASSIGIPAEIIVASWRVKMTISSRLRTPGLTTPKRRRARLSVGAGAEEDPAAAGVLGPEYEEGDGEEDGDGAGALERDAPLPAPFSWMSTGVRLRLRSS